MSKRTTAIVREELIERRRALLGRFQGAASEEQRLLETHEPDWEDEAANVSAARVLDRLGVRELTQLRQVQAALDRIEQGIYGKCLRCRRPIEPARLEALPETDRCAVCAERN